jgi:hypothetical protein
MTDQGSWDNEDPDHDLPASGLEQLFRACPSITEFDSWHGNIDQAGLDALLAHGTNITSLVVRQIDAQVNRSDAQCRWSRLFLTRYPTLLAIANLPLKTVQQLQLRSGILTMQLGLVLQLPVGTISMSQLPARQPPTWHHVLLGSNHQHSKTVYSRGSSAPSGCVLK